MLLGRLLFFPAALIGFCYVASGQTEGGLATFLKPVALNGDEGQTGGELVEAVRAVEWDGAPVFGVALGANHRAAETALRGHKVALLLVIPPGFTAAPSAGVHPAELSLAGDPHSGTFIFARSFLSGLLREFTNQAAGWTSLSMMCGLLKPDAGRVPVCGVPMDSGDVEVCARVGVCPQDIVLWERLTCPEVYDMCVVL